MEQINKELTFAQVEFNSDALVDTADFSHTDINQIEPSRVRGTHKDWCFLKTALQDVVTEGHMEHLQTERTTFDLEVQVSQAIGQSSTSELVSWYLGAHGLTVHELFRIGSFWSDVINFQVTDEELNGFIEQIQKNRAQ